MENLEGRSEASSSVCLNVTGGVLTRVLSERVKREGPAEPTARGSGTLPP